MKVLKIEREVDYEPISCTFHDHLEHFASLREHVTIVFMDDKVERKLSGVRIADIIRSKKGEFIQFVSSGIEMLVRLDSIISVNEKVMADCED